METTTIRQESLLGNVSMEDNERQDSSTFMEEVETHMTYKVASYIDKYWFPTLIPIGLVGNSLSFLVMVKHTNRKMSTCIYMAAISVNDNLMMGAALHYWLVSGVNLHRWYVWECKLTAFLHMFCLQTGTYQILSMTIDKYIAIKWPHRAATYSTPRRARFIALGVFVFTLTYNVPHFFVTSLRGIHCTAYSIGGIITKIYSWTSFIVNGIIPFSMLIYMNCIIVKTIRKSRQMFGGSFLSSNNNDQNAKQGTDQRQRTMKNAEIQLTIMLLLVTLLFSILLIPTYIRFIYLAFVKSDTPAKFARSMLMFQITFKLYVTNNGVNFFLYCISGRKFRNDLKEILFCGIHSSTGARKGHSESTGQVSLT